MHTGLKFWAGFMGVILFSACASTPAPNNRAQQSSKPENPTQARGMFLPDNAQFLQTDARWAMQTLGGSQDRLKTDGCLVTAAAMALVNLGFQTDPGDLAYRLKAYGGFNNRGWLIWSGLEKATAGKAKTVFYDSKDDESVRACLRAGYYPLVRFHLSARKTHWAMVVGEAEDGFYVRDPMVGSQTPIPLSTRTSNIEAVRCIGVRAQG